MDVKTMLLGYLMSSSMTGYEIKKKFSRSFLFFSGLSYGSIYPALKKMEQEGLITLKVEIQDGSPNRKIYTITDEGRKVFMAFLARLFFFAHLTPEERLATAKAYLDSIKEMQRNLTEVEPQIRGRADEYQYLCYSFGVRLFEDLLRNVEQVVEELEQKKQEWKVQSPKKGTHPNMKGGDP
jgi:DNA-binding PadR family transcriptional regulator